MKLDQLGELMQDWFWAETGDIEEDEALVTKVARSFEGREDHPVPAEVLQAREAIYANLLICTPRTKHRLMLQQVIDALDTYILVRGLR